MNTISDYESLQKLCDGIVASLRDNSAAKLDQLLTVLKIVCREPSICSSTLPSEETLVVLIRSRPMRQYLGKHHDHCARLIGLFLNFKTLNDFVESCLKVLFDCLPSKGSHIVECSRELSSHAGFAGTSVELAEIVFKSYPIYFERQLLLVYSDPRQTDALHAWAKWSAQSSQFFQALTSLLNEALRSGPNPTTCLRVIDALIRRTEVECEAQGRDFLGLYPRRVQHLVAWMRCSRLEIDSWPSGVVEYVQREFDKLKECRPRAALALLSHFKDCHGIL